MYLRTKGHAAIVFLWVFLRSDRFSTIDRRGLAVVVAALHQLRAVWPESGLSEMHQVRGYDKDLVGYCTRYSGQVQALGTTAIGSQEIYEFYKNEGPDIRLCLGTLAFLSIPSCSFQAVRGAR